MHIDYLILRLIRHFTPAWVMRMLLRYQIFVRPGLETRAPAQAAEQYQSALEELKVNLAGKRVMVFGYGGRYAIAYFLLRFGAGHIILCDPYAPPDQRANLAFLSACSDDLCREVFSHEDQKVMPNPAYITVLQADIRSIAKTGDVHSLDLVLSRSVFEHLDQVEPITQALTQITKPTGVHLHFIDLRDHFFKYPFEMLTFSEHTWRKWLNPTSNLNRYRYLDYQRVFQKYFGRVTINILEQDQNAFRQAAPRIQPAFLSGDETLDSITQIMVTAQQPLENPAIGA